MFFKLPSRTQLKRLTILALFAAALAVPVRADESLRNASTEDLKRVFRSKFNHEPTLANYQDLAAAIDLYLKAPDVLGYDRTVIGGFWNGFKRNERSSTESYEVVEIHDDKGKVVDTPLATIEPFFLERFHHAPNTHDLKERSLAVNTYVSKTANTYAGGFWNGERTPAGGKELLGIVFVESGSHSIDVPLSELSDAFKASETRNPRLEDYAELSRAIVYWCKTHSQKFRGGFWNGETANNSAKGRVYGIILAGRY